MTPETPPPQQSPAPPGVAQPAGAEVTGVFPASRDFTRWVGWVSTFRSLGMIALGIAIGAVLGWREVMAEARAEGHKAAAAVVAGIEPRVSSIELMRLELYDMRKEFRQAEESRRTGVPVVLPPLPPPPIPAVLLKDGGQ